MLSNQRAESILSSLDRLIVAAENDVSDLREFRTLYATAVQEGTAPAVGPRLTDLLLRMLNNSNRTGYISSAIQNAYLLADES